MQRKMFGLVSIAVVGGVLLTSAVCRAGDASKQALVNPVPSTQPIGQPDATQVFTDCYSKGTVATAGKKFTVKAVKVTGPTTDGLECTNDDYICLSNSITHLVAQQCNDVAHTACGPNLPACPTGFTCGAPTQTDIPATILLRANVVANPTSGVKTLSVKHDLCKEGPPNPFDPLFPKSKALACGGDPPILASSPSDFICYNPDTAWEAVGTHVPNPLLNITAAPCMGVLLGVVTTDTGCTNPEVPGSGCINAPTSGIVLRTGASICK